MGFICLDSRVYQHSAFLSLTVCTMRYALNVTYTPKHFHTLEYTRVRSCTHASTRMSSQTLSYTSHTPMPSHLLACTRIHTSCTLISLSCIFMQSHALVPCVCIHTYVRMHAQFKSTLVAEVKSMKVGDNFDLSTFIGPVIASSVCGCGGNSSL